MDINQLAKEELEKNNLPIWFECRRAFELGYNKALKLYNYPSTEDEAWKQDRNLISKSEFQKVYLKHIEDKDEHATT